MKIKTLLLLAFTMLATLQACKPDEPEEKIYMGYFPATVPLQYLYFKPGSYWIYECDSTGELDSQVMVSIDTPWTHQEYIDYQFLKYVKKSITYQIDFRTIFFGSEVPYNRNRVGQYYFSNSLSISGPDISATDCVFFYPFDSNSLGGFGSSPTYYKGHYDSMQVLGRWYKDVRVFQVQYAGGFVEPKNIKTWGDGQITYYWAKNVGLIRQHVWTKKDGLNTTFKFNWNLRRFFINK